MTTPLPTDYDSNEDRTLPAVVYGLYLLGLLNGLTILVGLLIAYANRDSAGPRSRTHYIFEIRTFWTGIGWAIIGAVLLIWGIPLSFVLIGVPLLMVSWTIFALLGVWFALRCILGLVYLSRGEAYPRPRTWLV